MADACKLVKDLVVTALIASDEVGSIDVIDVGAIGVQLTSGGQVIVEIEVV